MSNSHNESVALKRIFDAVPVFGYALAMQKDTFTDVGDRLLRAGLSDPDEITADIAGPLYDAIYAEAVTVGLAKHKPMKDQSRKSRNTQVSKLANFPIMAGFAQVNPHVMPAYEWLRTPAADPSDGLGIAGYTKVVGALVAMKALLVKDANASEGELRDAIVASLAPAKETASEAVAKIADMWEALVHGDKSGPSLHADAFSALLAGYPADMAERVASNLAAIKLVFADAERAKDKAAALAKVGA